MDADALRIARDKLTRVFRYLEALNQHRDPAKRQSREQLWTVWFRGLSDHSSVRRGSPRQRTAAAAQKTLDSHSNPLVQVKQRGGRPILGNKQELVSAKSAAMSAAQRICERYVFPRMEQTIHATKK
jgi:hypothetical protein